MKAKKQANNRTKKGASLHDGGRNSASANSVHPDVILDAGDALRSILGRLTKLEADVDPRKEENKKLRRRNQYLEVRHRDNMAIIRKQNAEIKTLKIRLEKLEKPKKDSHNSSVPPSKEDMASAEESSTLSHCASRLGRSPEVSRGTKGTLCIGWMP